MVPYLRSMVLLILTTAAVEAQGNLSELFSIIRKEGPVISEADRTRTFEILRHYSSGESLAGEWQTLNEALSDPKPFVRDQACAILATIVYLNAARPVDLPDTTRELVLQRFGEAIPNLRENAVRVIGLMAGGVPAGIEPQLLRMARTDPSSSVRSVAILALASVRTSNPGITEFWLQSLKAEQDKALRGMVLSAFRLYAQTDPTVISLVIDALRDKDYFVRQEAASNCLRTKEADIWQLSYSRANMRFKSHPALRDANLRFRGLPSTENNMASGAKIAYGSRPWATCQPPNVGAALFVLTNSASATQIIQTPTKDRFACSRSLCRRSYSSLSRINKQPVPE